MKQPRACSCTTPRSPATTSTGRSRGCACRDASMQSGSRLRWDHSAPRIGSVRSGNERRSDLFGVRWALAHDELSRASFDRRTGAGVSALPFRIIKWLISGGASTGQAALVLTQQGSDDTRIARRNLLLSLLHQQNRRSFSPPFTVVSPKCYFLLGIQLSLSSNELVE